MAMKTVIVANQKGGIGKTTVARHLAFYGLDLGKRVLVVDFDVQKNMSDSFHNIAAENGIEVPADGLVASGLFDPANTAEPVFCGENLFLVAADEGMVDVERQDLGTIIQTGQERFMKLSESFDLCVVDTGPAVSNLLVVALSVGDFAVSPCKPDRDAIKGLMAFFSNVVRVTDATTGTNPKLASLGVLPNQISKDRAFHRDTLNEMRELWGDGVLPVDLYERAAIDVAKDRPVWRTNRGESRSAAAQEMKAVCACIFERMGLGE